MCAIAGIISESVRAIARRQQLLNRWQRLLLHRGPDDWGWHLCPNGPVLLFHRRLAITGLARGKQPLCNEDGQCWLVFNGEIYNHTTLRAELIAQGHHFNSDSDGEVVLHLYEQYGLEAALAQLNGEFAFALYDARQAQLHLARDRFGVKPLFYAQHRGDFHFASEIKGIFADPTFPRAFDPQTLRNYINTFYFSDETLFKHVRAVKPAHFLTRNLRTGVVAETRYWSAPLGQTDETLGEAEALEALRHYLRDAVRLRLPGEVPLGVFLSGGLDAAAIAQTIRSEHPAPFPLFNIGFNHPHYDESSSARLVAEHLKMPLYPQKIDAGDLKNAFVRSIWHSEIPVTNPHGAAKMLLAQQARQQVKVVLTGEGADELLWGYELFQHLLQIRNNQTFPDKHSMRGGRLSGPLRHEAAVVAAFGAYPYPMLRHFYLRRIIPWMQSATFRAGQAAWQWQNLLSGRLSPPPPHALNDLEITQTWMLNSEFPAYLLNYLGDRPEMAASIEGRPPFLDFRLAEFACRLPAHFKVRNGQGKYLLREAMAPFLPAATVQRPKQAFYAPALESLDDHNDPDFFQPFVSKTAFEAAGVLQPLFFKSARQFCRLLPRTHALLPIVESVVVWMLSLQILHELFIRDFEQRQQQLAPGQDFDEATLEQACVSRAAHPSPVPHRQ